MALRAAQQFETVKRLSELCPSNVAFPMSQLPPFASSLSSFSIHSRINDSSSFPSRKHRAYIFSILSTSTWQPLVGFLSFFRSLLLLVSSRLLFLVCFRCYFSSRLIIRTCTHLCRNDVLIDVSSTTD